MTVVVFTNKRQMDLLRAKGKIYTVRLANKKDGLATIYYRGKRVAKGFIRKVGAATLDLLEKHVELSGFRDVHEWAEHVDRFFFFRGLTSESWGDLAVYEVVVTDWLESDLDRFLS